MDVALAARETELERTRKRNSELEHMATYLAEQVVARERQLREASAELERSRGERDEAVRALVALADELEALRRQARGQATRIRLRALRDAAEVSERIAELAKRPAEARERLLAALADAIERLGSVEAPTRAAAAGADARPSAAAVGAGSASARATSAEGPVREKAPPSTNGHDPDADAGDVFDGLVEVEVGPLRDFSQLVGFEDAASGIGAAGEIAVKRFTQGRATLELRLRRPVELLRELEERAPFEFHVRDTREGRVILDVDGE